MSDQEKYGAILNALSAEQKTALEWYLHEMCQNVLSEYIATDNADLLEFDVGETIALIRSESD